MTVLALVWGLLGIFGTVAGYEGDPATGGITVTGRVSFSGVLPIKAELLPVLRDKAFCGEGMPDEALKVEEGSKSLEGVVISLEGVTKGKPLRGQETLVLENRACRFLPRATAAIAGSVLEIRNNDPILHNTHIRKGDRFGPTLINVAQPTGAKAIRKPLHEAGLLDVRCGKHSFMRASIQVFEHPYFAVTNRSGQFELTQVPPGTYRLTLWHERLGVRVKTITVPARGALTVDLEVGLGK